MNTETNTNAVTVNEAKSPEEKCDQERVDQYADRINTALRKTQESILHLASVVYEASTKLNKSEWIKLGERVGSAAQLSRYVQIGKRLTVLERHQNKLPKSMTSIYRLASKLEPHEIESEIQAGNIHDLSTNKHITAVIERLHPSSNNSKDPSANVISLVVNSTSKSKQDTKKEPAKYAALMNRIKTAIAELKELGFEFELEKVEDQEELTIDVTAKVAA